MMITSSCRGSNAFCMIFIIGRLSSEGDSSGGARSSFNDADFVEI